MPDRQGEGGPGLPRPLVSYPERLPWPDAVRVMATYLVVLLHVSAPLLLDMRIGAEAHWTIAGLYHAATRSAVPVFVMISGMFLLQPHVSQNIARFLNRRLLKIGLPFIGWSYIYLVWQLPDPRHALTAAFLAGSIRSLLEGTVIYHFWFFYLILGLYLATPLLRTIANGLERSGQTYCIALWLTVICVLPTLRILGVPWLASLPLPGIFMAHIGYFLLGYWLKDAKIPLSSRSLLAILFLLAATTCFLTYAFSYPQARLIQFWFENFSPTVVGMTLPLFFLLKRMASARKHLPCRAIHYIQSLGTFSFGIYCAHVLILEWFSRMGLTAASHSVIWWPPAYALMVFATSALLIACVRKITPLRWLVP